MICFKPTTLIACVGATIAWGGPLNAEGPSLLEPTPTTGSTLLSQIGTSPAPLDPEVIQKQIKKKDENSRNRKNHVMILLSNACQRRN